MAARDSPAGRCHQRHHESKARRKNPQEPREPKARPSEKAPEAPPHRRRPAQVSGGGTDPKPYPFYRPARRQRPPAASKADKTDLAIETDRPILAWRGSILWTLKTAKSASLGRPWKD